MKKRHPKSVDLYGEVNDNIGNVSYVEHLGSDKTIVNAARVSYGKEIEEIGNKDRKLIQFLMDQGHTSPFEHCVVTFRFRVPIFVARQHMRHRVWSFNEVSRRYSDENIQFYEPIRFRQGQDGKDKQMSGDWFEPDMTQYSSLSAYELVRSHHDSCFRLYDQLLLSGVTREMARAVLPVSLYTEYYGTCDLNNLMKFLDLRTSEHAQWEIRQVAFAIEKILTTLYPVAMNARKHLEKDRRPCKWTF